MSNVPYIFVRAPSTFDPKSRPIYLYPLVEVNRKSVATAYPILSRGIDTIAARHPETRILVHTVSYDLAKYITSNTSANTRSRITTYDNSTDRQRAIDTYLTKKASILVAASLDRGIDLPGDDCRAIVVCKVPFPNLGDKQVSARLHSPRGQSWYNVRTVRSIVQMTGRGMRSADDFCESYILDKQFISNIWKKSQNLLPIWWKEALVWDRGPLWQ